ncbi:ATP-dependent DNA helicase [Trichonephila clavipes]|nr:ATP-dependent DNA helicase [Trichonephila clavipes]
MELDDDSTDVWKENWFTKYQKRPEELSDVTIAQFVAYYNVHSDEKFIKRQKPRIIRYRSYDMSQNLSDYKREMVTLHIPFRSEDEEILAEMKFIEIYRLAGCGKTFVIKHLTEIYNRYTDNDGYCNAYITCASTGKAAVAIAGTTVHTALKISLSSFGGLDIIFIGDLRQLPPVRATPIYKQPKQTIAGPVIWRNLKFYELDQVMCQVNQQFSSILTKIGNGERLDEIEISLIESRFYFVEEAATMCPQVVKRFHIPLVCACATTIQISQGSTFPEIVYEYEKHHSQSLLYIALFRVTSIEGLYITTPNNDKTFYHGRRTSTSTIDLQAEFKRLSLNKLATINEHLIEFMNNRRGLSLFTFNCQSLRTHIDDLDDSIVKNSNVLVLSETWLKTESGINITNFKCIVKFKRPNTRAGGEGIYHNSNDVVNIVTSSIEFSVFLLTFMGH